MTKSTVKYYTRSLILSGLLFFTALFLMFCNLVKLSQERTYYFQDTKAAVRRGDIVNEMDNLEQDHLQSDPFATRMLNNGKSFCNSNFITFGHFAKLSNIILDPNFGEMAPQTDSESRNYLVNKGFFQLACTEEIDYKFDNRLKHLNSWIHAIKTHPVIDRNYDIVTNWTIAISRSHNGSVYFTMIDIYNVYLLSRAFSVDPALITILFIDGHPANDLDEAWKKIFQNVVKISDVKKPIIYKNLIWGMANFDSPLNYEHEYPSVPNLEEFRKFVLRRHRITSQHKKDCENLNLLVLHSDDIFIKFDEKRTTITESGIYRSTLDVFSDHNVIKNLQGSMHDQLETISKVDIYISVHKEDLVHILFLPNNAAVLEIFLPNVPPSVNKHYQSLARWRDIPYKFWGCPDKSDLTTSPLNYIEGQIAHLAGEVVREMCVTNYKRKQKDIWVQNQQL